MCAVFAEQALRGNVVGVDDVHERVRVLGKGGCENYYFVVFTHLFDELDTAWSNAYVDRADATFDVNW